MQNVEDASVRIVGLDTIRVRIKERREKFQMSTEDGYYTLDASGYILRKTNQKQKIYNNFCNFITCFSNSMLFHY